MRMVTMTVEITFDLDSYDPDAFLKYPDPDDLCVELSAINIVTTRGELVVFLGAQEDQERAQMFYETTVVQEHGAFYEKEWTEAS